MRHTPQPVPGAEVVGPSRALVLAGCGGAPLLGAALGGFVLPPLGRWVDGLGVAPFRIVFRFLGGIDAGWEVLLACLAGAVLGLLAGLGALEGKLLSLTVGAQELRLGGGDRNGTCARSEVSAVYLDGLRLVVLGADSFAVLGGRLPSPGAAERIAKSLRRYGYPWRESDPYAGVEQLWDPGRTPGLPAESDALLGARETARERRARAESDSLELALRARGWAVRDRGGRQYVRPLGPPPPESG